MAMAESTLKQINKSITSAMNGAFYKQHFKGISVGDIDSFEDFLKLPFTEKADLRKVYPLGLAAVGNEEIVRIHASSGTTGNPVLIPYTQKDIRDWMVMFQRCYKVAGVTTSDRIQITPGYGLWTAGIGFQLGAEQLGAMTIPIGPSNTEKQLEMMVDLEATVLAATSSYALVLAEEVEAQGLLSKICLKKGILGSECWGKVMRSRISRGLGIDLYDIYGLTEVYGPGIGISCDSKSGIHMWSDFIYFEIVDPTTGRPVPKGEVGELVITTLQKEGAPLIRYRTHDLTRELPGKCMCGLDYPRIDTLIGRTDDMIKIKGTLFFPSHIEGILAELDSISSEYQLIIDHVNRRDTAKLYFETSINDEAERLSMEKYVEARIKIIIGISLSATAVSIGALPRSKRKASRIFDRRKQTLEENNLGSPA